MADLNETLQQLFSDPEKLSGMMNLASSLLGQGEPAGQPDGAAPPAAPATPAAPAAAVPPEPAPQAMPPDPLAASVMAKALPVISAVAESGRHAVRAERINLLNALRPFVSDSIGEQMTHAVKLVSLAKMAKTAMGELGVNTTPSTQREDETSV